MSDITPEQLQHIAALVDHTVENLTGERMGFIVMVMPKDQVAGEDYQVKYASNIKREVAVASLKQTLFRWGCNDEWMTKL